MSSPSYATLQAALSQAVAAELNRDNETGQESYSYICDFDDDSVVYMHNGETLQDAYTTDDGGNITLAGKPEPVRPVTTYVPSSDARAAAPFETRGRLDLPRVEVRREPLTYEEHVPYSYFRDLALGTLRNNGESIARIERHNVEMRTERHHFEQRARRRLHDEGFELRADPNTTPGLGGYFALPLWLNQYFATGARAPRVLADAVPSFDLPQGVHSINLPRLTTGTTAHPQQDVAADPEQDVADAAVTAVVTTITGMGDVALQLLEQSPPGAHLDWAWFKDLAESYDAQLEAQLLFGSGAAEDIAGVVTVAGTTVSVAEAVTGQTLWTAMAQAMAQVADSRQLPPQMFLLRTGRWAWLGAQQDQSQRMFATPGDAQGGFGGAVLNGRAPVGAVLGVPTYLDEAIPAALSGDQDAVIACRPADLILFEDRPVASVHMEVLSGTLQARLQLRNYAAALTGRYPSGIGVVTGAGMAYPSGY